MSYAKRFASEAILLAPLCFALFVPATALGAEAVHSDTGHTQTTVSQDDAYAEMRYLAETEYADMPNPQHNWGNAVLNARASQPYWKGSTFYSGDGTVYQDPAILVIDVSEWQETIDWERVKASGVDAAIIRLGYGIGNEDEYLARNLRECERLGIPYGLYLYSYAYDSDFARDEAIWTATLIERYDAQPTLPIYYDLEEWTWTGHKPPTSAKTYEGIVNTYVNTLKAEGITDVAVYSYTSYLQGPLNAASIWKRASWVAQYGPLLTFSNPYEPDWHGWQYTSSAKVPGVSGNADLSAFVPLNAPETGTPGWYELGGNTYYYDETGVLARGWFSAGGKRYYADAGGALRYGWLDLDGERYRLDRNDGHLWASAWFTVGGARYYAGEDGAVRTGWFEVEGRRYYADSDGSLRYGWLDLDGERYRLDRNDGHLWASAWFTVDGGRYYAAGDGVLARGWLDLDGVRYRMDKNTWVLRTGWYNADGSWYYGDPDRGGAVDTEGGWARIGGRTYYLEPGTGARHQGWLDLDGERYRLDRNDGHLWASAWFTVDGVRYYADASGRVV